MLCSSPLKAIYNRSNKFIKIVPTTTASISPFVYGPGYELINLPCGQCIECRINKAREWATRCMLESKYTENNWFLTLTYNDENLHFIKSVNRQSGVVETVSNLEYSDIVLFLKRLRRRLDYEFGIKNVRFFLSGEYGNLNGRSHWHLILFNCPLPDVRPLRVKNGFAYFTSSIIESCWYVGDSKKESAGFHVLSPLSYEDACYTAKYTIKKINGKFEKEYHNLCRINGVEPMTPELMQASRSRGIGFDYFKNDFKSDAFLYSKKIYLKDGKTSRIPRYYERLFKEFPEEISDFETLDGQDGLNEIILDHYKSVLQERAEKYEKTIKNNISISYDEYLKRRHDSIVEELKQKERRKFEIL